MNKPLFDIDMQGYICQFDPIFRRPIAEGYHALPVGNGDLAAVMWQPDDIHIMLNKSDLGSTSQAAEIIIETDHKLADKIGLLETRLALFESRVELEYTGGEYDGRQDWVYRGKLGQPPEASANDQGRIRASCFVASKENVAIINYTHDTDVEETLKLKIRRWLQAEYGGTLKTSVSDNIGVMQYTAGENVDAQDFAIAVACTGGIHCEVDGDFQLSISRPSSSTHAFQLVVSVVSRSESAAPEEKAVSLVKDYVLQKEAELRAENLKARVAFWSRFYVDSGHPYLTALYYVAMYELGITSQGSRPVQFNGGLNLWNELHRYWPNGFWCHNQSSVYLPVYAANHFELGDNFHDWIVDIVPEAKKYAAGRFGTKGVVYNEVMAYNYSAAKDLEEPFDPTVYDTRLILTGGVRYMLLLWSRFQHSQDVDFLKEKAYPLILECIAFYTDYAVLGKDGKYHIGPAVCWEEPPVGTDAHSDCAAWRALFKIAIKAAEILGVDEDKYETWNGYLERAPDYPLDGEMFSIITRDDGSVEPCNHYQWQLPNLSAVYPFSEIGIGSNESLINAASATYQRYRFNADAGHEYLPLIAARLGNSDGWRSSMFIYIQFMQNFDQGLFNYYNNSGSKDEHDGNKELCHPYLEGSGILASGVNEMLLQSHEDLIRVFPAIPDHWTGRFTLSAEGGYLVSSEYIKDEGVKFIQIYADKGDRERTCRIMLPWPDAEITVNEKHTEYERQSDIVTLLIQPGDTVLCAPNIRAVLDKEPVKIGFQQQYSPCRFGNIWLGNKDGANNHNPEFPLW